MLLALHMQARNPNMCELQFLAKTYFFVDVVVMDFFRNWPSLGTEEKQMGQNVSV